MAAARLSLLVAITSCNRATRATPTSYELTLGTAGTGTGTLTVSPAGPRYPPGTFVNVVATPGSGSTFAGWSGACGGSGGCVVTLYSNTSVMATFRAATIPK